MKAIIFIILTLSLSCKNSNNDKRPTSIPPKAKFDKSKNIYTLTSDGHSITWYPDGKIYKDCLVNTLGILDGECKSFSGTDGKVLQIGSYKNRERAGEWIWNFPNGNIYVSLYYTPGKKKTFWLETDLMGNENGEYKRFYLDNKLEEKGFYIAGTKDGVWEKYYRNGNLEYKGSFKSDQKIGLWNYYYADGIKEAEIEYNESGIAIKKKLFYPNSTVMCLQNETNRESDCK